MSSKSSIVGPLNFSKDAHLEPPPTRLTDDTNLECMFCENRYNFREAGARDIYLGHLYMIHRLVIADVAEIACLASYNQFWRDKFRTHPVDEFCSAMLLDQLPDGTPARNERYFLLSDVEPLDRELRQSLKNRMMELVLARHQFERTDIHFDRGCLYCRDFRTETRADFIRHLYEKHFLQLGKPENLVFVDELIDTVQSKIEQLICLYCEKVFKDRSTLKEHMRKKGHKRINPDNKEYDRFFLVNYRNDRLSKKPLQPQPGTKQPVPVRARERENSPFHSEDSDSDWSDWQGEEAEQQICCLFCKVTKVKIDDIKNHMKQAHSGFDFDAQVTGLTFYQRVKIVNYVRRQMHVLRCVTCKDEFSSEEELLTHLKQANHYAIGPQRYWDQPEFFFPTYEDDLFLCHLEDDSSEQSDDSSLVISENVEARISTEAESLSLERFKLD